MEGKQQPPLPHLGMAVGGQELLVIAKGSGTLESRLEHSNTIQQAILASGERRAGKSHTRVTLLCV